MPDFVAQEGANGMPLPLIAAALIAVGAASGGSGIALGSKGAYDIKQANDRLKKAGRQYQHRRAEADEAVAAANLKLCQLGKQQEEALEQVVVRMGQFLRRNRQQVQESERLLVDGIDVSMSRVAGLTTLDVEAVKWISGAIGSAAAGAGAGAGVTAAASGFGVASTGAAISGLSGAAAESATLALLGGGSLATGGGGMALGATVLNFVTIGPALLVGGFVVKGQGTKALTQAREFEAEMAIASAELDEFEARLMVVQARTDELGDLLGSLVVRGVSALDLLESEPFDPTKHAARFQRAMTFVMAVRDVASTPVVDSGGELNQKAFVMTVKYRPMTEENEDA